MWAGGWRCGGPGRATGDTASVYTSAGDWMEGVSSAGGVKSISSSKWSSNSCMDEKQEEMGNQQEDPKNRRDVAAGTNQKSSGAWLSPFPPGEKKKSRILVTCRPGDSHLEVDLPLLAAGHAVHQQHHQSHERRQRHHQGRVERRRERVASARTWSETNRESALSRAGVGWCRRKKKKTFVMSINRNVFGRDTALSEAAGSAFLIHPQHKV